MRTVYRSTTIHEPDDDAIRIDRQYPDCQGAWDHRPAIAAAASRHGDRVTMQVHGLRGTADGVKYVEYRCRAYRELARARLFQRGYARRRPRVSRNRVGAI